LQIKLNKLERLKRELKPIDFNINSCNFTNLSEDDRFYLKNYGIYNIKLSPNIFMLRIRLDGGVVEKNRFKKLVNLAKEYNLKLIITARAGLELHYIKPKDILTIYNLVKEIGFTTHQSLTDNIRAITLDPYDGIAKDSFLECFSLIEEIKEDILNNPKYFGMLPRKFNATIISRVTPHINPWSNDLLFALSKDTNEYGFNVYIGGKNSEVAKSVNIFVKPKDLKRLFISILDSFIELGLRGSRSKTRLFYLIEAIGIKKFRDAVEERFGSKLSIEQKLIMQSSKFTQITKLKGGAFAKVLKCNYGDINLDKALVVLSKKQEIRVGVDQNLHIIDVKESKDIKTSSIIACAGGKYCSLSLWDIKEDVKLLNLERFSKESINIGFSGCLKGCGKHHHSHIGLVGLRTNMFGSTQKALRVFIGASEVPKPAPGRLLYYAVPLKHIDKLFKVLIDDYKAGGYKDFNEFNIFLEQFSIETLQLWYLLRQLTTLNNDIKKLFYFNNNELELLKELKKLNIYPQEEEVYDSIKILSHKLWDN